MPDACEAEAFLAKLKTLPTGYSQTWRAGRRYGITVSVSPDGRRRRLLGEELGGTDRVSCNVYLLAKGGMALRPCEMPAEKVIRFVLDLRAESRSGPAPGAFPADTGSL